MEELYKEIGKSVYKGLCEFIYVHEIGGLSSVELKSIAANAFVEDGLFQKIYDAYENKI